MKRKTACIKPIFPDLEIPEKPSFGALRLWGFGVLGFWVFGVFRFWVFGVLGFWVLGFWVLGYCLKVFRGFLSSHAATNTKLVLVYHNYKQNPIK